MTGGGREHCLQLRKGSEHFLSGSEHLTSKLVDRCFVDSKKLLKFLWKILQIIFSRLEKHAVGLNQIVEEKKMLLL